MHYFLHNTVARIWRVCKWIYNRCVEGRWTPTLTVGIEVPLTSSTVDKWIKSDEKNRREVFVQCQRFTHLFMQSTTILCCCTSGLKTMQLKLDKSSMLVMCRLVDVTKTKSRGCRISNQYSLTRIACLLWHITKSKTGPVWKAITTPVLGNPQLKNSHLQKPSSWLEKPSHRSSHQALRNQSNS